MVSAFALGSVGVAEAQLWKPKKKAAVSAKKPAPRKAARAKKPVRKKKPASSSVVKFGPKEPVDEDAPSSRDRDADGADDEVDDNPRITVYDGDRDE